MHVVEIDVQDDEMLRRYWEAGKEGEEFEQPYATYWSLQAMTGSYRSATNSMQHHPLAAIDDDGTVVGINQVSLPRLDNRHVVYMGPSVRPAHRRRGIGTALLEAGLDATRDAGRTTVIVEVNRPVDGDRPGDSAGSLLAAKHGFTVASLELHRVLSLPVPDARLDELATRAAPYHSDYTFVSINDVVPDELMAGYCRLQEAFNSEAPLGELDLEPEKWDEERVRQAEERFRAQGRRGRAMAAIAADGTMVALTEMMTTDHNRDIAWQGGTLVLKEHRGRRLGLALKVANLEAFQVEFPDVRTIHSWNAEENGPMVAINDLLGFRPVEYTAEMQRRL